MNKTIALPLADLTDTGNKMYNWLGQLWTTVFNDKGLVKNWTSSQGMLSAQLYLNFLETAKLIDRKQSPVYHRDRWRMIKLKRSEMNTGDAVSVYLGSEHTPVIGKQISAPFVPDKAPVIGGSAELEGVTAYPLPEDITDVITAVTDDIAAPTHVLASGIDFEIKRNTILFYNHKDPFKLGFPTQSVRTDDTEEAEDTEVALWLSDVLVDKDNVYAYLGHVLGIKENSSEFYSNYLNALWDLYNQGASLSLFNSGVAALLDEPYIQNEHETVQIVTDSPRRQVITDQNVYDIPANAVLNDAVTLGNVLHAGDLLTKTVCILSNLDPVKLSADEQDAVQFKHNVPALCLPSGFFRANVRKGLGLTWDLQPITYQGKDANDNPKLRFTVYGSQSDIDAFWTDFEQMCETKGISGKTCFDGYLNATLPEVIGAEWGTVSPLEYFLSNFLKSNLFIITVDSGKLSIRGKQTMHRLSMLRNATPAHTCFLVIERRSMDEELHDLGAQSVDDTQQALSVHLYETASADAYVKTNLVYKATKPHATWIPTCRRSN